MQLVYIGSLPKVHKLRVCVPPPPPPPLRFGTFLGHCNLLYQFVIKAQRCYSVRQKIKARFTTLPLLGIPLLRHNFFEKSACPSLRQCQTGHSRVRARLTERSEVTRFGALAIKSYFTLTERFSDQQKEYTNF